MNPWTATCVLAQQTNNPLKNHIGEMMNKLFMSITLSIMSCSALLASESSIQVGDLQVAPAILSTSLTSGKQSSKTLSLENTGSTSIQLEFEVTNPFVSKASSTGPIPLDPTPERMISFTKDPETGLFYGGSYWSKTYYRYNSNADTWVTLAPMPFDTSTRGNSVWHKGKIYHVFSNRFSLAIYEIASNSWETMDLSFNPRQIASNGDLLFLQGFNTFQSFDPTAGTFTDLPEVSVGTSLNGMLHQGGYLYAWASFPDGREFFRFHISSQTWQTLPDPPMNASSIASHDAQNYYLITNTFSETKVHRYHFSSQSWSLIGKLPFTASGAYLIHHRNYLYVSAGSNGTSFVKYPRHDWAYLETYQLQLSPGETEALTVHFDAADQSIGAHQRVLTMVTTTAVVPPVEIPLVLTVLDGPAFELAPQALDFGTAFTGHPVASELELRNCGTELLVINKISAANPEFSFDASFIALEPGESKLLTVTFNAATVGKYATDLVFESNDGVAQVAMQAISIDPPVLEVTPVLIEATNALGVNGTATVTVANQGLSVMTFDAQVGYTTPGFGWVALPSVPSNLEPGQTVMLDLGLNTSSYSAGTYRAVLRITSNDPDTMQVDVPVTVTVPGIPDLQTDVTALDFGDTIVQTQTERSFTVENRGTSNLVISAITPSHPTYSVNPQQFELLPEESTQVAVIFSPDAPGAHPADLTLTSNDDPVVLTLMGNGIPAPEIATSPDFFNVSVPFGGQLEETLSITNNGNSDLQGQIEVQTLVPGQTSNQNRSLQWTRYQQLDNLPFYTTFIEADPKTGYLYAQEHVGVDVYRFDPFQNSWSFFSRFPTRSFNRSGSLILHGQLVTFLDHSTDMFIMDLDTGAWERKAVGISGRAMATDGTLIYLSGSGEFKSYDPSTGMLTSLPPAPSGIDDTYGGLLYIDGFLYSYKADGSDVFERFHIQSNTWESLPNSPDRYALGSTVFDGKIILANRQHFYIFDPATLTWQTQVISLPGDFARHLAVFQDDLYFSHGNNFNFYRMRPQEWVSFSEETFSLPAGASLDLMAQFNSADLEVGTYQANVKLHSNDPNLPLVQIPARMTVTPSAALEVFPKTLRFGKASVGFPSSSPLHLRNTGQLPLTITDIDTSHGDFQISKTHVVLAPGEAKHVDVVVLPSTTGPIQAVLTVESVLGSIRVDLEGEGVNPPDLDLSATEFVKVMNAGDVQSEILTITNNGTSTLEVLSLLQTVQPTQRYTLSPQILGNPGSSPPNPPAPRDLLTLSLADLSGVRIGYWASFERFMFFTDMQTRGVQWVPIYNLPENIDDLDIIWMLYGPDNWGPAEHERLHQWIAEGGALITESSDGSRINPLLPPSLGLTHAPGNNTLQPADRIYPHVATQGVQEVEIFRSSGIVEFTGRAIPMVGFGDTSTNPGKDLIVAAPYFDGKVIVMANHPTHDFNLSVSDNQVLINQLFDWALIKSPGWLYLDPQGLSIAPGESRDITLTFDGAAYFGGAYAGEIHLTTNDPANQQVVIPVDLTLMGEANATVDMNSLDFGNTLVGNQTTQSFELRNPGTLPLDITDVNTTLPEVGLFPRNFTLAPSESRRIYAVFQPSDALQLNGVIRVESQRPTLEVSVTGSSQHPPEIVVTPEALAITLPAGLPGTINLDVANTGSGPLQYRLWQDQILIIGDGGAEQHLVQLLEAAGHETTVVADDASYQGSPSPADFAATILLNGATPGQDMPLAGQQALLDAVQAGGGLLIFEWLEVEISNGRYQLLAPLCPLERDMSQAGSYAYQHAGNHPILKGIPQSFTFETGSNNGQAVSGDVLVTSPQAGDAVVIQSFGQGTAVQFAASATWENFQPLDNPHFAKLVKNTVAWLASSRTGIRQPQQPLAATTSTSVPIQINTQDLSIGSYSWDLTLTSNDPDASRMPLPLTVHIPCRMPDTYWGTLASWTETYDITQIIPMVNEPCP